MVSSDIGSVGYSSHHDVYETIDQNPMYRLYASNVPTIHVKPVDSSCVIQNTEYGVSPCQLSVDTSGGMEATITTPDIRDKLPPLMSESIGSDDLLTDSERVESDDVLDILLTLSDESKEEGISSTTRGSYSSKRGFFLKYPENLEYPDEVPDGKGGMRKRGHFFFVASRSKNEPDKKIKMMEAWDPIRQLIIHIPYSTMLKRKKDRVDNDGNFISRSTESSRTIVAFDEQGNPLSRSVASSRAIVAFDEQGRPISRSKASARAIVAFDEQGNPISRSKAFGRAIVAFDEQGNPLSRSIASSRAIVAFDDDGQPISRSKASGRSIVAYDDRGFPISRSKAYKRTILGYDNYNKAVSRGAAWKRYIKAVPVKNRVPKTGFLDWCCQHLNSKPTYKI